MRVISKQISLENFTSRLPGVTPAYVPGSNKPIFFDETSLKGREYEYTSNYGLVPMSVNTSKGCLSWERISYLYNFFTDYFHLLNDWGHCGVKYKKAVDYYANESKNGYANQMVYGSQELVYINIDEYRYEWESVSGDVYSCIPTMDIPEDYQDYWKTKKLFYPDYIKWKGWFTDRYSKYSGYTGSDNCSGATDCCDCTEYFNRGGNDMYNKLMSATFDIPAPPLDDNLCTRDNKWCFCKPAMQLPVSLQVSIDDLGEFSIFSEEYKLGTDYRVANDYGDTDNTRGGTVVSINGHAMRLKDMNDSDADPLKTYSGFTFNSEYMEMEEDDSQWEEHKGDKSINRYSGETVNGMWICEECGHTATTEFATCPICGSNKIHKIVEESEDIRYSQNTLPNNVKWSYGFGENMAKVMRSGITIEDSEKSVRIAIAGKYKVSPMNSVIVGNVPYDVETEEYGYYKGNSNRTMYVYRETYTETPYTNVNGKRVYADVRPQSLKKYFYFPFFVTGTTESTSTTDRCGNKAFDPSKYKWYPRTRTGDTKNFISYGGGYIQVTGNTVSVEGNTCQLVVGSFSNEDGMFYVGKDNKIYIVGEYDLLEEDTNYELIEGGKYARRKIDYEANVFQYGVVSGVSASKLTSLRSDAMLVDDTGEALEGKYDVSDKINHQPPEGTILDLLYEKGNVANMIPIDSLNTGTTQYYYGDMITEMEFYYVNNEGEKQTPSYSWSESSLNTITGMTEPDNTDTDVVWCDVEYVLGGTWVGTKETKNDLDIGMVYSKPTESGYNPGVTYKETVRFVKTQVQYKLALGKSGQIPTTMNSASANTLCYPVWCYILTQETKEIKSNFGTSYNYPISEFEMTLPPNSGWSGYSVSTDVFPVFREEYRLGVATLQNLDVDIYIGRGTNAAFEKHIKLGEVTSMEALEQYTNGYFKMMEN